VDGSAISENHCGTHTWLQESTQWKEWMKGGETLWITGDQGLGKTHLTKFIINLLRRDSGQSAESALKRRQSGSLLYDTPTPPDASHLVLSYFCDARRPSTQEDVEVLKSFLYQILTQDHDLFKYLYGTKIFPTAEGTFPQFRQAFEIVLRNREGEIVDIVIDAIDECDKQSRDELRGFLTTFESIPSIRIILTSKPAPDVLPTLVIRLNDHYKYHQTDLLLAVQEAVKETALQIGFTLEFSKEILETILKKTNGMLAAQVCLNLLENIPTVRATREILRRLPEKINLSDLLLELLNLRTDSNRNCLIIAYFFTCCSRRTFSIDELLALLAATTAAGVGSSQPQIIEIYESVDLNVKRILKSSRREFLEVQDGTVALVHEAITAFLLTPKALQFFLEAIREQGSSRRFQFITSTEGLVQCLMAEACLKYMSAAVRGSWDPLHANEYCFEFWSQHAREAQYHYSEELLALVSDFLDPRSPESEEVYAEMIAHLGNLNNYSLLP
jgi:energy-coupling factor transporter ATP-binding protein EcfA2